MRRFILIPASIITLVVMICHGVSAAGWETIDACFRPDANPWAKQQVWDGYYWSEGWGNDEQFYPKYFKPAGSLHLILKNNTGKDAELQLSDVDGMRLEEIATTDGRVGRVIWRNIFPKKVQPGGWVECIIRLRSVPTNDVKLGFDFGGGRVDVTVPAKVRKTRIESVSFSPETDKIYVYIRALDGSRPQAKGLRLDGVDVNAGFTSGPDKSGIVLAEAKIARLWEWGTYHLIEITLADGTSLAYPVRAWDSYFAIGLFGNVTEEQVEDAVKHNFNTYVVAGCSPILDKYKLNYIPRHNVGEGQTRTTKQSGNLFYNNIDEPDGLDAIKADLPFMDRLGVYAQREVLPRFWEQYERDPRTPAMVLVNNTYKPLNYYVYGQTCDVLCTDPYVPLGGGQVDYVGRCLNAARDAAAPNPLLATIWACAAGGTMHTPQNGRPPSPEEERMMVFYALGSGIKGLTYFADRDTNGTGESLTGLSHFDALWSEVGRINADVKALAPYLSIGCPIGSPVENDKVWSRTLMCGKDALAVIVVNKGHFIGYNTKKGFAWHDPAKDVDVSTVLPGHMKAIEVMEVKDGKLSPAAFLVKKGVLRLKLDSVDTARAFVISLKGK